MLLYLGVYDVSSCLIWYLPESYRFLVDCFTWTNLLLIVVLYFVALLMIVVSLVNVID